MALLIIGAVVIIVIAVGAYVFMTRSSAPSTSTTSTNGDTMMNDEAMPQGTGDTMQGDEGEMMQEPVTTNPDGSKVMPDGSVVRPDGTVIHADGSMTAPDASMQTTVNTGTPASGDTMMQENGSSMTGAPNTQK